MSFIQELDQFVDYVATARPSIKTVTVAVRERTARRALKLKKCEPLAYKGLELRCIGSKRWRSDNGEFKAP